MSVSILSVVRIKKNPVPETVRCLSVQPDKDKTELSELSLSSSADVRFEMTHELDSPLAVGYVKIDILSDYYSILP